MCCRMVASHSYGVVCHLYCGCRFASPLPQAKSIEPELRGLWMFLERKKKQFSHAPVVTPTTSSNQLEKKEICGLCLDSDVHSPS